MTVEQVNEASRLAGLWATARVRRAMTARGYGGPRETNEGACERERQANKDFHEYLRSLITEAA